uniref:Gelsolin-like domain-containing protein n=2 Tax=Lygus hesperus TaxID=30085 RepID=A0A0K8SZE6_LYGHE
MTRVGGIALLALAILAGFASGASIAKSVVHPAFKEAGKKAGLQIWRIERFEPVPVPSSDFGKFYEGDSYIALSTKEDKQKKLSWDIYYWLGSKTSQDESGAAAILAVELDDGLGGGPVQHREVQGHESNEFLQFFKPAIRYVPGGVASGFNHVEINAPGQKRLYQIKGKKNIRVQLVEPNVKSMNKGDCFILDNGKDLYIYVGPNAKGTEKLKARAAANQIKDQDHHGRAKVYTVDSSATKDEVATFFKELGSGSAAEVPDAPAADDDLEFEKKVENIVALYKVSDAGGKLQTEKVGEKPLKSSMLKPEDCFILDTGAPGIYVWIGKNSNTHEKVEALKKGQVFLKNNNYPAWTSMTRVVQGAEPSAFKEYFAEWRDATLKGAPRKP